MTATEGKDKGQRISQVKEKGQTVHRNGSVYLSPTIPF